MEKRGETHNAHPGAAAATATTASAAYYLKNGHGCAPRAEARDPVRAPGGGAGQGARAGGAGGGLPLQAVRDGASDEAE